MTTRSTCANSAQHLDDDNRGGSASKRCVAECPKATGGHAVVRKKYKPDDLNTAVVQCSCGTDNGRTTDTRTADVQVDMPKENDDPEAICDMCRCTEGFCNPVCESNKQKLNKNRSDSIKVSKNSAIPVPVRNSAPGLTSPVAPTLTSCKCLGKCTPECQREKLKEAVEVIKCASIKLNTSKLSRCQKNQCTAGCSNGVQVDMEEPPIGPLAPVPMAAPSGAKQPQSEASNICIACQCEGPCSVQCLLKREQIKNLLTEEDLNVTRKVVDKGTQGSSTQSDAGHKNNALSQEDVVCEACDCNAGCNDTCQKNLDAKAASQSGNSQSNADNENYAGSEVDIVCEACDCNAGCNDTCQQNLNAKAAASSLCVCPWECSGKSQESNTAPIKDNQTDTLVKVCHCATMCNSKCDQYKITQTPIQSKASQGIACDLCKCIGICNEICKAAKKSAEEGAAANNASAKPSCEVCMCPKPCNEVCEIQKKESQQVCADCKCKAQQNCLPKCQERMKQASVMNTTQVKGIIERFNDNDLIDKSMAKPYRANGKAKSSCDMPDEPICDPCECRNACQPKCAAIRKIRSASEYPPNTSVCVECKCNDKCTPACQLKKTGMCRSLVGQPLKCNDANSDWIPCVSCKDGAPCSPECRQRLAIVAGMPSSAGAFQCSEPTESRPADSQTMGPSVMSCNIQTCDNLEKTTTTRTTSTPNSIVDEVDTKDANAQYDGAVEINITGTPNSGSPEDCCGMCMKLRSYLAAMFQGEGPSPCGRSASESRPEAKKQGTTKDGGGGGGTCGPSKDKGGKQQQSKPHRGNIAEYVCKCSHSLGAQRSSYTDRMHETMAHLQSSVNDAETAVTPYIKTQSIFTLDVNNQQEAIYGLLGKCKEKDQYIDALIADILDRSQSKVFDRLISKLQETNANAPDFDSALITSALDDKCQNSPVCGIDLTNFKVNNVKRIGPTSLLVKWVKPVDGRIVGYDINVNGVMKMKVDKKETSGAIIDALDFSKTISIEVYAKAPTGRAYPCALAYYAKY